LKAQDKFKPILFSSF